MINTTIRTSTKVKPRDRIELSVRFCINYAKFAGPKSASNVEKKWAVRTALKHSLAINSHSMVLGYLPGATAKFLAIQAVGATQPLISAFQHPILVCIGADLRAILAPNWTLAPPVVTMQFSPMHASKRPHQCVPPPFSFPWQFCC
jgi:hypothetical protein